MITRWNSECLKCMTNKFLCDYPESASEPERMEYTRRLFGILSSVKPEESSPVVMDDILKLQKEMFGISTDFTEIKQTFNKLMLEQEVRIAADINSSEHPIKRAIQYVMTGNYIDFGVLEVDNDKLFELLGGVDEQLIDEQAFSDLYADLKNAKKLAFLTDNCGEIVLDKLLIKAIQSEFPDLHVDIIVREMPAVNDATMEDAIQTGLTEIAPVTGNGTSIAGTYLPKISAEASQIIHGADLLISKGQGNFESLQGCGLNIYYIFLCKCILFTKRFHKRLYEGILINEKNLPH